MSVHDEFDRAHKALHKVWTDAVPPASYNKADWIELDNAINVLGEEHARLFAGYERRREELNAMYAQLSLMEARALAVERELAAWVTERPGPNGSHYCPESHSDACREMQCGKRGEKFYKD